jgi:hypothetical protein
MNLVFRRASCVAVGAFNMYIIQPGWMMRKGLIPEGAELNIESKLDEPGFRYKVEASRVRWVVTPTRVIVESESESEDCGAPIARLLQLLPETPVSAVGNTSIFLIAGGTPAAPQIPVAAQGAYNVKERNVHFAIEVGKVVFNLGLRWKTEEAELLVNALRPISEGETSPAATQHAGDFLAHRGTGLDLASRFLGV